MTCRIFFDGSFHIDGTDGTDFFIGEKEREAPIHIVLTLVNHIQDKPFTSGAQPSADQENGMWVGKKGRVPGHTARVCVTFFANDPLACLSRPSVPSSPFFFPVLQLHNRTFFY